MYKISQEKINTLAQVEIGLAKKDALILAASQHVSAGESQDFYLGFGSAMDLACTFAAKTLKDDPKGEAACSVFAVLAAMAATEYKAAQLAQKTS